MTFPNATLMPSAATGTSNISSVNVIFGGGGYTAPVVSAVDASGMGTGATFSVTESGGAITAVTPILQGSKYVPGETSIVITDPTGSGAIVSPVITNNITFTASSGVFNSGMVGDVIRIGNNNAAPPAGFSLATSGSGQAVITGYTSSTVVTANVTQPITNIILDDPTNTPAPVNANFWSISVPTSTVSGLNHLEGMQVTGLADGGVIPATTVVNGAITLQQAASAIVVGLPFTAQLQTLYLDPQGQPTTTQGKRKIIPAVTVRVENTRGISCGVNQPDASTQPFGATVPWTKMVPFKERNALYPPGTALPLYTGDIREHVIGQWDKPAQVAIQTTQPLPANILAVIPEASIGDTSS